MKVLVTQSDRYSSAAEYHKEYRGVIVPINDVHTICRDGVWIQRWCTVELNIGGEKYPMPMGGKLEVTANATPMG